MTLSESAMLPLDARPRSIRIRLAVTVLAYGAVALVVCLLAPLVGSTRSAWRAHSTDLFLFADNVDAQIFFVARMPRVLAGAIVGAALASAGVVLQALLRNPLATPFTLGVSAGAALGAMLAISLGAAVTLGPLSPCSAGEPRGRIRRNGGRVCPCDEAGTPDVHIGHSARRRDAEFVLLGAHPVRAAHGRLYGDVPNCQMADGRPRRRRIRADRRRRTTARCRVRSVRNASLVAQPVERWSRYCGDARRGRGAHGAARLFQRHAGDERGRRTGGPDGFIGIVVPHLVRLMTGVDHRLVLPASALFGAAFLVGCDLVARTILAPVEMPVGIVTAMVGAPFSCGCS